MALTFTSWTNYTDDDGNARTLDWSSAAAIRGYPLRPHAEAIRQALVERYQATGTTVPAALNVEVPLSGPALASWASAVQSAVTNRIAAYVNHTDNGGDWSGQTVIPNWTEADILSEIGAGSRLAIGGFPSSEWAFQQYQILNLLLWKPINSVWSEEIKKKYFGYVGDWSGAQAAFLAQPWEAGTENYWLSTATQPNWAVVGFYSPRSFNAFRSVVDLHLSNSATQKAIYDFYLIFYSPSSGYYYNPDYPTINENVLTLMTSGDLVASETDKFRISDFDGLGDVEPVAPDKIAPQYYIKSPRLILKYNVPGGFIFQ